MQKYEIFQRGKCLILYSLILIFLAFFISIISNFVYSDVLLILGIIFSIIGGFSISGGFHIGNGINTLGQSNSQYVSKTNLEMVHHEKESLDRANNALRTTIFDVKFHSAELMLSGILCIIISLS
ncbi:hypothetical protein [Clostridium sp.]|uniref:hypothetical protein n=1 Tax=Clostridium sp. TaxID=1506 RepID=UPI0026DBF4B0|nr:hypothetical protein [Clostridium sp.]MDO5038793.1 hypothetical protein [Clostridium sp.]